MPAEQKFPGKVKPPPPALMKWPGHASSRILPPPPKGEAPKPPAPDVPKAIAKPVELSAEEQPAQKKAAITSKPKPVPVASSAAVFLEPASKAPPAKADQAGPASPPSSASLPKSTAKSKSLVTKSRPKSDDQVQKPEPVKIEASECKRCCAKTFKGQLECDVCGLMLEGIPKAERTAIAERRKAALHKLGLFYDFKGEYFQTITRNQLETLGLLGDQARGSSSPRPTSSSGQKAVWKERMEWASLRFWTGLQKMPNLRKACWLRERMNTIVSVAPPEARPHESSGEDGCLRDLRGFASRTQCNAACLPGPWQPA